ncbi:hypothetical protein ACIBL5_33510 [Streptomyces sp. NPDC050516]|uniref:hypothetical protein n=1 Tax=Streptomyces sp. NPDC050516 TaxID=3365621 RepID=UPI00379E4107
MRSHPRNARQPISYVYVLVYVKDRPPRPEVRSLWNEPQAPCDAAVDRQICAQGAKSGEGTNR